MWSMHSFYVSVSASLGLVTGQTTVSSDVTSKYGKLSEPYTQGFVLDTFKGVPGVAKMGWNASEAPFQGIYSRPFGSVHVWCSGVDILNMYWKYVRHDDVVVNKCVTLET